MPLFLQHALIVIVNTFVVAVIGALVNRRLGQIKVYVNGRLSGLEQRIAEVERGEGEHTTGGAGVDRG